MRITKSTPRYFRIDEINEAEFDGARSMREGTGECIRSFSWKSLREYSIWKTAAYIYSYLILVYLLTVYATTPSEAQNS